MDCSRSKTQDPDEWMEMTPEFSRPLAEQVREWVIGWEPDLSEAIKWNILCFTGRKLVCGLSACKRHLGITFFRGVELPDPAGLLIPQEGNLSILSVKLTTLEGFNTRAFRALLRAAVELDADPDAPPPPKVKREPLPVPEALAKALQKHRKAAAGFAALSPSCQREYIVWVGQAKLDETRDRRVAETIKALESGRKWMDRKQA